MKVLASIADSASFVSVKSSRPRCRLLVLRSEAFCFLMVSLLEIDEEEEEEEDDVDRIVDGDDKRLPKNKDDDDRDNATT